MMQLIVLGQVPGTRFQITFGWFVISLLLLALPSLYRLRHGAWPMMRRPSSRPFNIISLRQLDQA